MKVLVLGASGMLGSIVTDYLSRDKDLQITAAARNTDVVALGKECLSDVQWEPYDVLSSDLKPLLKDVSWVVNAIGITKPLIRDDNAFEIERAIRVNSLFPHDLTKAAEATGAKVIQIATDCGYSGAKGKYTEEDIHDAMDVYGKTKSLGEVKLEAIHNLRCSIIGPEIKDFRFLLEWFRRQPQNAEVNGFTNHEWNGVTTLHFGKLCHGIIKQGISLTNMQHVIPSETLSKANMLKVFAEAYGRPDVKINEMEAGKVVDRTLETTNQEQNAKLWKAAGYDTPPTVAEMIREVSQYDFRMVKK